MARDHTTGFIRNLRTKAAHPMLADHYRRFERDLWVFEICRLEDGRVMIGLQSESGENRCYAGLLDLEMKYEKV